MAELGITSGTALFAKINKKYIQGQKLLCNLKVLTCELAKDQNCHYFLTH